MNPRALTSPLRSLRSSIPLRPAAGRVAIPAASARLNVARTYSASADAGKEDKFHAEEDKRISELESAKKESDKKAEELAEQIKELKKEIQYVRADYQTAVRRAAEDKIKNSEQAIAGFARALLGTVDILSTALRTVPQPIEHKELKQLYDGVELTQKALIQTFGQHKMKRIENLQGQQFDPNFHEAEFMIPKEVAPKRADGEPHGPGEIMQVNSEGWLIGDRVLRPAKVGVVQPE